MLSNTWDRTDAIADAADAALIDVFGLPIETEYEDLDTYKRKYVIFALTEHTDEHPILPVYPVRLFALIRYVWWLQFHGVKGGYSSIKNYVAAIMDANSAAGHPDCREEEPWTWRKFRHHVPKHLLVVSKPTKKLALQAAHFKAIALDADLSNATDIHDLSSYAVAWFSTIRVGHFAPKSRAAVHTQHLLRWLHVAFLPSVSDPVRVFIKIDSTKTRAGAKVDHWWTAFNRNDVCPAFCAVRLLLAHYHATYRGDSNSFVWAGPDGSPQLRGAFTTRLRQRLARAAPRLGLTAEQMNLSAYSGISIRKGALSALAGEVAAPMLAMIADHKSFETTNKFYITDTVELRASNATAATGAFAASL